MRAPSVLPAGTRLGPYLVQEPLGAGGMGEVYRAHDPRLGRQVAIKVLPEPIARGEEARQRFDREARAVAALSHPNILAIHDVGSEDGRVYAVMELLEGETLRARLERGALPWPKATGMASAVADGLATAHAKGIVHRDLKPANIFLTADGRVKVLDFGLAKLREPADPEDSGRETLSQTDAGRVTGTVGYMSPEQVAGRPVDARSDIFSLGCVLYELVSGQRAFARPTAAETMAAVLNADPPPLDAAPLGLRRLIAHCLEKDPEARFQSARDLAFDLRALLEPSRPVAVQQRARRHWRWLAAALGGAVLLALATLSLRGRPEARPTVLAHLLPPEDASFCFFCGVALSPDGRRIAFVTMDADGKSGLWVRSLGSSSAQRLAGTERALHPFWSPDSRSLGFFADRKLKTIDVSGGAPQVLCEAKGDPDGAAWSPQGVIVFAPDHEGPLYEVSAHGGSPRPATALDRSRGESSHRWPAFLPDGRRLLYFALTAQPDTTGIMVATLGSPGSTFVQRSRSHAVYAPPGHLLFLREDTLVAAPFDPGRARSTGEPAALTDRLWSYGDPRFAALTASPTGLLAYAQWSSTGGGNRFVWVDRSGREIEALPIQGDLFRPELSHDGRRVAVSNRDMQTANRDIWVYDLPRGVGTRLTFDPGLDNIPAWSSDDKWILFSSNRKGQNDLYRVPSAGTGGEELVFASDTHATTATSWSSDGRHVIFNTAPPQQDVWSLSWSERKAGPLFETPFLEWDAQISPDSRWIAYTSNETGQAEIYVQAFPPSGAKWRVSTAGGIWPQWRGDGKELFYFEVGTQSLMAAGVGTRSTTLEAGVPRALFTAPFTIDIRHFDVAADGRRFLLAQASREARRAPLTLVQDWPGLLAR